MLPGWINHRRALARHHRRSWRGLVAGVGLLVLGCCGHVAAQTVALLHEDAPRDNTWETLQVTLDLRQAMLGATVGVQDARGGPEVRRVFPVGAAQRVIFPLPLVNAAELPPAQWPIRVRVTVPGEAPQVTLVKVRRPTAVAAWPDLRLAVREDPTFEAPLPAPSHGAVVPVRFTTDEMLTAPALAFACCDALWIDNQLARQLTPQRAAELIAAGPKLLRPGVPPPEGRLAALPWEPYRPDLHVWQTPPNALPRLRAVEPALRKLPRMEAPIPASLRHAGLMLTPLCIVGLLLLRIFTARPLWLWLGAATLFSAVAGAIVGVMDTALEPRVQAADWTTRPAPGAWAVRQRLEGRVAPFDRTVDLPSDALPLLPLAAGAAEWFGLAEVTLDLDGPARGTQLHLPARRPRWVVGRQVSKVPPVEAPPLAPDAAAALAAWGKKCCGAAWDAGFRITAGQVTPESAPGNPPIPLTHWIAQQPPGVQFTLHTWYELEFQAAQQYHVSLPADGRSDVSVMDLHPADAGRSTP